MLKNASPTSIFRTFLRDPVLVQGDRLNGDIGGYVSPFGDDVLLQEEDHHASRDSPKSISYSRALPTDETLARDLLFVASLGVAGASNDLRSELTSQERAAVQPVTLMLPCPPRP